jgi:putative oxidoreductase
MSRPFLLHFLDSMDARRRFSIGGATAAANTWPTALFLCCSAKRFRFSRGDMLSLSAATRYESGPQSQGETIMNETLAAWTPRVLSLLRIYAGLLLFAHGTAKILGFPAVPNFANVQINSLVGASGLIELIGGALFTIGLFTRPVAFILSGFAAVAYFLVSAPKGFHPILNNGELASLFSFVFLYFVCAGPGPWSLDAMMKRK